LRDRKVISAAPQRSMWSNPGSLLDAAGVFLLLLCLIALLSGGTFSPLVFFAGGAALLLRRRMRILASPPSPVKNSVLLRSRLNPFAWFMVSEAKASTRDIEGALSGLSEQIIITSNPTPTVLLASSTSSWSRRSAEANLVRRIRAVAKSLVPLGVYLLPLDSVEAGAKTSLRSEQILPRKRDQKYEAAFLDYGAVAIEGRQGFVNSFVAYTRPDSERKLRSLLVSGKEKQAGNLTVREVVQDAIKKIGTPRPDEFTAFLGAMAATEGETLGHRVIQLEGQGPQALTVASPGSTQVRLTREQLRTITEIYQ
jgi:hypothetical protein